MYKVIMINVDELWLKGKNRPQYFKAIKTHIEEVVTAFHPFEFKVKNESQRMIVRSDEHLKKNYLRPCREFLVFIVLVQLEI